MVGLARSCNQPLTGRRHEEVGRVGGNAMSREFLGNCKRCGQPVREDHSYVMVVPVGRGRMFFHAGCEPITRTVATRGSSPESETGQEGKAASGPTERRR